MGKATAPRQLLVRALSRRATTGTLTLGSLNVPCALGRGGVRAMKREGDGATPLGRFALTGAFYRPDKLPRPRSGLCLRPMALDDGWCDATGDRNYNRFVHHPYRASAERFWRDDPLYDIVIVLGYNSRPRIQGRGSAIFMHVARQDLSPTEGCIALRRADLLKLLPLLGARTMLSVAFQK